MTNRDRCFLMRCFVADLAHTILPKSTTILSDRIQNAERRGVRED
jgi:hypothetical protein